MGHQNNHFTGNMIDMGTDQQGHSHLHPDPCNCYGMVPNFQHNSHSVVPASGNRCNFNFHPTPEHNESALVYGIRQYNGMQPHHPPLNFDFTVAASSGHYNPYLPPSGIRDFPGWHDQLSLPTAHRVTGIPTRSYFRNIHYIDDFRSFKRKNAEGALLSSPYQNVSQGSDFVAAPMVASPPIDAAFFPTPKYGGNDPTANFDNGSLRSVRNGTSLIRPEPVLADTSNLIQGNYVASPVSFPRNPWLDVHFGATNGNTGTFAWVQAPNLSYTHGNGASVEAGNMGVQAYRATGINRIAAGAMYAPIALAHSNPSHPTPPMQGLQNNPFPEVVDAGRPTFLAPAPPISFRLYQPQQREVLLGSSAGQHNLPHLRVLPEDEVAILEVPSSHEYGDPIDLHRDMRLDIDHMSYEELLALEERIGSVGTGFTEEFVQSNLKTRTFNSFPAGIAIDKSACPDQQKINFCVICQTDYEYEEKLGALDCGHEYHGECIKKWLLVKNTCPICKSTALSDKVEEDL